MRGELFLNEFNIDLFNISGDPVYSGKITCDNILVDVSSEASSEASLEASSDAQIVNAFRQDFVDRVDIVIMVLIVMLSFKLIFNTIVGWK